MVKWQILKFVDFRRKQNLESKTLFFLKKTKKERLYLYSTSINYTSRATLYHKIVLWQR